MRFFVLSPEVAAMGLGSNTVMDRRVHPPTVSHLHYDFDVWLGDELLESFPCFIVTERLRDLIEREKLEGVEFGIVEVSTSEQFRELYGDRCLPRFARLKPVGIAGQHDFGTTSDGKLVASERALGVLKNATLERCGISEFKQRKERKKRKK